MINKIISRGVLMPENKENQKQNTQMKGAITGNKYENDPNIKRVFVKSSKPDKENSP